MRELPAPFRWEGDQIVASLPGARLLFSARAGGVSEAPYDSLNLGRLTDDVPNAVEINRDRFAAATGCERGRILCVRQVHGVAVRTATATLPQAPEADGIVTTLLDSPALVFTADCLPVMLAGGDAVAALHCGWRGLARGMIARGIAALEESASDLDAISAALGPCARGCCYEVGEGVHAQFPGARVGERNIDLAEIARSRLLALGISEIHDTGICTICDDRFFSHRGDAGVTGRQAAAVWRPSENAPALV